MTNVSRVIGLISVSLAVAFVMHLVRLYVLTQPQRSIFTGVFREGPIPVDTLYTEPESFFADPLHSPASGSNLMTTWGLLETDSDDVNKTLFTFAGYNAGPTRIARLRNKAKEDGLNPNKWFGNVELEVAEEVGEEPVLYVDNIYKYYVAYKLATKRKQELQKARAAGS